MSMLRQLFLLLLTCIWCQAANPTAPYRDLTLGPARAINQTFRVGHTEFNLNGQIATLSREGRIHGLFFQGHGTAHYRSVFEPEKVVMTKNAAEWTHSQVTQEKGSSLIVAGFTKARFLAGAVPLPEATGTDLPVPTEAYKGLTDRLQGIQGFDPFHLLTLQVLGGGTAALFVAEMTGPDQDWLYRYDTVQSHEEELDWLRPNLGRISETKGWLHLLRISRQPLGWDPRTGVAPVTFVINHLDVDLRTKDNRNAQFRVQENLSIQKEQIRSIQFDFMGGFITEDDERHLSIQKITDDRGQSLDFDQSKESLLVDLKTPYPRGTQITLTFEYEGDILYQPGGDNYWELGVRESWYPSAHALAGELYTFHSTVRTKGAWISFLPGETVRREVEGEWNLVETRSEKPLCFATILGGKYFVEEETRNGLTIRLASYAFKVGVAKKALFDQAFNIIGFYTTFLGPFPFKEFLIIEKNDWGYGQAPPGMMYITKEAFNQHMDWGKYFRLGIRKRYAHEIAHQYWGTVVKMPSPEDQWVTEAFADYSAALYERDFKGQGEFGKSTALWKANALEVSKQAPIPLANDLRLKDGYDSFKTRTYLLYDKGPNLLLALHQEMGDTQFLTFLKSLQTNFKWRFMTTSRMADFLKFMTKKDYAPFLERYFWGLEIPPTK